MQITSVTYRRLISFGQYEHAAVEATAAVPEGDDADFTLDGLRRWVGARLEDEVQYRDRARAEDRELNTAQADLNQLERDIEEARQKWEHIQAFFERLGVKPVIDEIPF